MEDESVVWQFVYNSRFQGPPELHFSMREDGRRGQLAYEGCFTPLFVAPGWGLLVRVEPMSDGVSRLQVIRTRPVDDEWGRKEEGER